MKCCVCKKNLEDDFPKTVLLAKGPFELDEEKDHYIIPRHQAIWIGHSTCLKDIQGSITMELKEE